MKWTQEELEELYRKANEKGANDPAFAKKIKENAKAALEELAGRELPEGFVLEPIAGDSKYAAAYVKPNFAGGEIDLNALKTVTGGDGEDTELKIAPADNPAMDNDNISIALIISVCGAAASVGPCPADVCGADACGADACGAAACGAEACGAEACGADACAADAGCGADACGAEACAAEVGCAAAACGADACAANVGCAADACGGAVCGADGGCAADACGADACAANIGCHGDACGGAACGAEGGCAGHGCGADACGALGGCYAAACGADACGANYDCTTYTCGTEGGGDTPQDQEDPFNVNVPLDIIADNPVMDCSGKGWNTCVSYDCGTEGCGSEGGCPTDSGGADSPDDNGSINISFDFDW